MAQKRTIAIDVDDVLAQHAAAFVKFSNEFYGTNNEAHEYNDDWMVFWGEDSRDEIERRAAEFHTTEATLAYGRIDEALPVLERLKEHFRLVIITARSHHLIDVTHEWLGMHFSDLFEEVHFVPIWDPNNTLTKADICNQIAADYLIDDVTKHVNLAADAGVTSLLFGDYKWNQDNVDSRVIRVADWAAVEDYFDGQC